MPKFHSSSKSQNSTRVASGKAPLIQTGTSSGKAPLKWQLEWQNSTHADKYQQWQKSTQVATWMAKFHSCRQVSAVAKVHSRPPPSNQHQDLHQLLTAEKYRAAAKLQALVYDILPSTTAIFSYAIGSWKLSANEQFFVGTQTVVGLLQTTRIIWDVCFITDHVAYASCNKTTIVWIETELFFFFLPGVDACHVYVRAWALGLLLQSY